MHVTNQYFEMNSYTDPYFSEICEHHSCGADIDHITWSSGVFLDTLIAQCSMGNWFQIICGMCSLQI